MYEQYLQSVVDSLPADYLDINEPHINDVLMRHKTLVETNDDLIKTVQEFQDDIESEQTRLTSVIKVKTLTCTRIYTYLTLINRTKMILFLCITHH